MNEDMVLPGLKGNDMAGNLADIEFILNGLKGFCRQLENDYRRCKSKQGKAAIYDRLSFYREQVDWYEYKKELQKNRYEIHA